MKINKISEIYEKLKNSETKKRIVVAYANDDHSIEAAYLAVKAQLIDATLIGDSEIINSICAAHGYDLSLIRIVHEPNEMLAAMKAVDLIQNGQGDFLMKGLVSTDKFMRAILNKEAGLVPPKGILSHVTIMEHDMYHKLLTISDVAVIPNPDIDQKQAMIRYVTNVANCLGINMPKIALVAPTEQVLPKVPSTMDAAILSKMGERGQIAKAVIEGPMGLDVAINKEAAEIKKVRTPVAGDADCLIFPNLDSGNAFYKTMTKFTNAKVGATMVGAKVPCVLSSRGDSVETKLNSIALSALLAK
ncbi:MAG: phosphate acyltransferase [Marinifilaceae bacterium]